MKTFCSPSGGRMTRPEASRLDPPHPFAGALVSDPVRGQRTIAVGRDSVEPTFERSEANAVSIFGKPEHRDARGARTASGGKFGSTESRPTGRFLGSFHSHAEVGFARAFTLME